MDNNTNVPVRMENIPSNPNDFVPVMLPVDGMPPQDPNFGSIPPPQDPQEQKPAETPQEKKEGSKEPTGINPEIASLFGEDIKIHDALEPETKPQSLSKAQLFDRLVNDQSFRKAFIKKYEPDMVRPVDPNAFAIQKLQEEFGQDFIQNEFSTQDAGIPGTKSFMYIRKYNQYLADAESDQKQNLPQDFEQLVKDYQQSVEAENEKLQIEKNQVMKIYGWNEQTFNGFVNFASKLGLVDLAYIYDKAQRAKQGAGNRQNPVFMAPGSANGDNSYQDMVNTFGRPISFY